jgi:anti-sigma B factor antagonist
MASASFHRRQYRELSGELDLATAPAVAVDLLGFALETLSSTIILDCTDLTFIDSSGIDMLVQLGRVAEKRIELINVAPGPRRVFELTGLCEMFGVEVPTEQSAD